MIRAFFLPILILVTASIALAAQTAESTSTPLPPSLACPAASGPTYQTPHKWVTVSAGVMAGYKSRVKAPRYPSDAKKAHIEGLVILRATISGSGDVEDLCVSQGPAELQQSAVDAVKTWKYKPYILNGQPVEVKTQINVEFTLR